MKIPSDDYAQGYQDGVMDGAKATEARIIKLLEDNCHCSEECFCTLNKAFALIETKAEPEPEITPQQLQINEIFRQASRDIAKLAGTMDTMGPKIDEIMANARAKANAIREGRAE